MHVALIAVRTFVIPVIFCHQKYSLAFVYVKCGVELSPSSSLQEYFEEDLPVSSLGFTSVVHLLSHLPVCEIERPSGTGDWLVFTKGNKTPKGMCITCVWVGVD